MEILFRQESMRPDKKHNNQGKNVQRLVLEVIRGAKRLSGSLAFENFQKN